jgi:hypothetical protein
MNWPIYNQEQWIALVASVNAETLLTASTKSFYWNQYSTQAYPTTTSTGIAHLVFMAHEPTTNKMHMLYACAS